MLATRPPVSTISAAPLLKTVPSIKNASEIFAPPSTNAQGRAGLSINSEITQYSFSNSLPMALGSTCSKPQSDGWSRWAAANASHTYRSWSGASFLTTCVSACCSWVSFRFISNSVCSSAQKRTLSSSSASPGLSERIASRAAGPHTSSMNFTSWPKSFVSTTAWGWVV